MMRRASDTFMLATLVVVAAGLSACGQRPSSLLRQGQLAKFDFPLYLTDSGGGGATTGVVYSFDREGNRTTFVSGLNNPQGVATDRYGNVYVVEQGESRLLLYKAGDGSTPTVIADSLSTPVLVSVDSLGEIYVTQDGAKDIIRARDKTSVATYSSAASAFTVGVGDRLIVGLLGSNKVFWGQDESAPSADVDSPVSAAIDGSGRVYVAQGSTNSDGNNGVVLRFDQTSPGTPKQVANGVMTPQGIAVDAVGNIYIVEKGALRIALVTYDGNFFEWANGLVDPQYLAFTQY